MGSPSTGRLWEILGSPPWSFTTTAVHEEGAGGAWAGCPGAHANGRLACREGVTVVHLMAGAARELAAGQRAEQTVFPAPSRQPQWHHSPWRGRSHCTSSRTGGPGGGSAKNSPHKAGPAPTGAPMVRGGGVGHGQEHQTPLPPTPHRRGGGMERASQRYCRGSPSPAGDLAAPAHPGGPPLPRGTGWARGVACRPGGRPAGGGGVRGVLAGGTRSGRAAGVRGGVGDPPARSPRWGDGGARPPPPRL